MEDGVAAPQVLHVPVGALDVAADQLAAEVRQRRGAIRRANEARHRVPSLAELPGESAADEPGGARDEGAHGRDCSAVYSSRRSRPGGRGPRGSRKVRTPQGRMPGNARAGRPADSATESRPPTARRRLAAEGKGKGETVR